MRWHEVTMPRRRSQALLTRTDLAEAGSDRLLSLSQVRAPDVQQTCETREFHAQELSAARMFTAPMHGIACMPAASPRLRS